MIQNKVFKVVLFCALVIYFSSSWRNVSAAGNDGYLKKNLPSLAMYSSFRVSIATNGAQGDGHSASPSISADGRFVTFRSLITKLLVPGDNNFKEDIFVYTMQTGEFTRVSVASNGAEANDHSDAPVLSADGQLVAFVSGASNLVPDDTNNSGDVFLYDLQSGDIRIVSTTYNGSQGDWHSLAPSVSADGSLVAFSSYAHNLVADDTNNKLDIFVCGGVSTQNVFLPLVIRPC